MLSVSDISAWSSFYENANFSFLFPIKYHTRIIPIFCIGRGAFTIWLLTITIWLLFTIWLLAYSCIARLLFFLLQVRTQKFFQIPNSRKHFLFSADINERSQRKINSVFKIRPYITFITASYNNFPYMFLTTFKFLVKTF